MTAIDAPHIRPLSQLYDTFFVGTITELNYASVTLSATNMTSTTLQCSVKQVHSEYPQPR